MKVELQNLTKIFPSRNKKSGDKVVAVSDFNFTIPDGKLVGLLGPSGCGKSTTLYMICGLQKPTSGKILFGEDDVTDLSPENRGVGLVFQNYALYPHMTVKQNILFPLQNLKGADKLDKETMLERAYDAAKLVQIDNLMDRKPSELSGGQQQRVAIARALVKMPRVLLLDEPLSNLDARLRLQTREEIRRIQQEVGITTIFVTHDQEEAMSISDKMAVMEKGVLQQYEKPELTNGIMTLKDGTGKLSSGAATLVSNNDALLSGIGKLQDGTNQVVDGVSKLADGSNELADGAHELADGVVEFNEEGINKLIDAYDGDMIPMLDRLQAVIDAGEEYQTYSTLAKGQTGNVKFIYKLASVKAEEKNE